VHTVSAALQDALEGTGIIISDSHNNAETIFQALHEHQASTPVEVETRAVAK